MRCMEELKGKWAFTKLPDRLKQESIELSSNRSGTVSGTAVLFVNGARDEYRIGGMYDKTTKVLMISFDGNEYRFGFNGGCNDNNIFVGRLTDDFDSATELKYLG
jgi:hypothetical protein